MRAIIQLPRAVHSSLRSSAILFDLTRVVEELVFNSLDAGATKVYVSLGVRACYVKVDDDGCGITRDSLVLLGERYATSKFHCLDATDAGTGTLGFRGEALSSLSDVSLLEVVTKAHGRPNGYRKVIKGCKCLFLGIDSHRQDVGTTVIVRDLFYNQPVRRKYLQSSPKKVLHSVKKCVLRTALVWPHISFRVTDIESDDELLSTLPSLSPLPLVTSGFGSEVSSCLHKVNFSEGALTLYGYLSGLAGSFSTKAFQFVYINSRFVAKSPIHKLMNNLGASFQCCLSLRKDESDDQNGKRHINKPHQLQAYPAYMLNLCCPRLSYELIFEPSKTMVDFKDWVPILSFIEHAVRHSWRHVPGHLLQGKSRNLQDAIPEKDKIWECVDGVLCPLHDASESLEFSRKKCKLQHHQNSVSPSPTTGSLGMSTEEIDMLSYPRKLRESHKDTLRIKTYQKETRIVQRSCSLGKTTIEAWDVKDDKLSQTFSPKNSINFWETDLDLFSVEAGKFLSEGSMVREAAEDIEKEDFLEPRWENESINVDSNLSEESTRIAPCELLDYKFDEEKASFLSKFPRSVKNTVAMTCPLLGNMPENSISLSNHKGFDGVADVADADFSQENSDFFMKFPWCGKVRDSEPSPNVLKKCQMVKDLSDRSTAFIEHNPCDRVVFSLEYEFQDQPFAYLGEKDPLYESIEHERCSLSPYSVSSIGIYGQDFSSFKHMRSGYSSDREEHGDVLSSQTMQVCSNDDRDHNSSFTKAKLRYKDCFDPEREVHRYDNLNEEVDWLDLDSCAAKNTNSYGPGLASHVLSSNYRKIEESLKQKMENESCGHYCVAEVRSRRSFSAPPLYRGKRKFFVLINHLPTRERGELNVQSSNNPPTLPVNCREWKHPSQTLDVLQHHPDPILVDGSLEKNPYSVRSMNMIEMDGTPEGSQSIQLCSVTNNVQDSRNSLIMWRNVDTQPDLKCISNVQMGRGKSLHPIDHESGILDISSGLLHLSSCFLVPDSISKDCLDSAKVLLQLDKKFIPVMAEGTLAIIDQHAADERIRLEELRQQVLSGEGKTITYLDPKKELILPESGFQLLQNYAKQIKNWGWLCNIHVEGSGSFVKNLNLLHKRAFSVTLIAVPCILGINLTDKDLIEFLEQLAETDGSSTMPPSVVRILNFKACRGAIMFGDSLLPSECSLIVEELRRTSLCFQCAHGRPTTIPLVNLEALHNQLAKLASQDSGSNLRWHGLHKHRPSLERAELRLSSARGHHG